VQTQQGKESHGLVREEWQECLKYLLVPAIMTHVRRRERQQQTGLCGLEMGDIQAHLELELGGASKLMLEGKWESPVLKQLNKAHEQTEVRAAAAEKAKKAHSVAQQWASYADSHPVDADDAKQVHNEVARTGQEAVEKQALFEEAKAHEDAVRSLCMPSSPIFFVSYDNCPSYSLQVGTSKDVIRPIIPLLQVCMSMHVYL